MIFTCAVSLFGLLPPVIDSQAKPELFRRRLRLKQCQPLLLAVMRLSIMHWRSQEPCTYGHHSCPAFIVGLADLSWDVPTSASEPAIDALPRNLGGIRRAAEII